MKPFPFAIYPALIKSSRSYEIAVGSDFHGNDLALDAWRHSIATEHSPIRGTGGVHQKIFAGDLVGYGHNSPLIGPNGERLPGGAEKILDYTRKYEGTPRADIVVSGNHEKEGIRAEEPNSNYFPAMNHIEDLRQDNPELYSYVKGLPDIAALHTYGTPHTSFAVSHESVLPNAHEINRRGHHGSYLYPEEMTEDEVRRELAQLDRMGYGGMHLIVGHTHVPGLAMVNMDGPGFQSYGGAVGRASPESIQRLQSGIVVPRGWRMIFNPGSVGQPRDRDPRIAWGKLTVTPDQTIVRVVRSPYDIAAQQRAMADYFSKHNLESQARHIYRLTEGR